MTAPMLDHAHWCSRPPLRPSGDVFDRTRVRWRCPSCGRSVTVRQVAP